MRTEGAPLQKIRSEQMIGIAAEGKYHEVEHRTTKKVAITEATAILKTYIVTFTLLLSINSNLKHFALKIVTLMTTSWAICGECGHSYTKHSWKSRGVEQWQCKNHRTGGKLTCKNDFVDNGDLEQGFIKAFNKVLADKESKIFFKPCCSMNFSLRSNSS